MHDEINFWAIQRPITKPNKPEDCILVAALLYFDYKQKREEPEKWGPPFLDETGKVSNKLNLNNPEHVNWTCEAAKIHARKFGIEEKKITRESTSFS